MPDWDEEKCRNFIIRNLEWVPRNFEYQDGLQFVHRQLEVAFGDENGHLSIGVLEELIEADGMPPFPESMFQRWKHAYRHRKESLEAPSTPHGRTILLPAVPTQKATENRLHLLPPEQFGSALVPVSSLALSLEPLSESSSRLPYTLYVSSKGKKASILSAPTWDEVQAKLDDPAFGRGGKMIGVKLFEPPLSNRTNVNDNHAAAKRHHTDDPATSSMPNQPSTDDHRHIIVQYICSWLRARCQYIRAASRCDPSVSTEGLREKLVNELNFTQYTKQMFQAEKMGKFDFSKHLQDQHWPLDVAVPNANFARKHRLVPSGEALPKEIVNGTRQHTLNEEDLKTIEKLWAETHTAVETLKLEGDAFSTKLQQSFFALWASKYQSPFPTSLFYDTGLDFRWSEKQHVRNESAFSRASDCLKANLEEGAPADHGDIISLCVVPNPPEQATGTNQITNDHDSRRSSAQMYGPRSSSLSIHSKPLSTRSSIPSFHSARSTESLRKSADTKDHIEKGLSDQNTGQESAVRDPSYDKAYRLTSMTYVPPIRKTVTPRRSQSLMTTPQKTWALQHTSEENLVPPLSASSCMTTGSLSTPGQSSGGTNLEVPRHSTGTRRVESSLPVRSSSLRTYIPSRASSGVKVRQSASATPSDGVQLAFTGEKLCPSIKVTSQDCIDNSSQIDKTSYENVTLTEEEKSTDESLILPTRRVEMIEKKVSAEGKEANLQSQSTSYQIGTISTEPELAQVCEHRLSTEKSSVLTPLDSPSSMPRELGTRLAQLPPNQRFSFTPSDDFGDQQKSSEYFGHRYQNSFGFDGACDDESDVVENLTEPGKAENINKHTLNPIVEDNGYIISTSLNVLDTEFEMDLKKNSAPIFQPQSPVPLEPLRINKQSKQVRIAKIQTQQQNNKITSPQKISPAFPPRNSSLRKSGDTPMFPDLVAHRDKVHTRQQSDTASGSGAPSTRSSSHRDRYHSDASAYPQSQDTARSTVSSSKDHHSGSTDIIGNFVPVAQQKMARPAPNSDMNGSNGKQSLNALANKPTLNPYQFEPDTPLPSRHYSHQTTFTDFITDPHDTELAASPNQFFLKKSPSAGNAIYNNRKVTPMVPFASKPGGRGLHRCDSSPSMLMPAQFRAEYHRTPDPDLVSRYGEIDEAYTPVIRRGRSPSPRDHRRGRSYDDAATPIAFCKPESFFREFRSESPLHAPTANEQIRSYLKESRPESPYRPPTSNAYYQGYAGDDRPVTPVRVAPRNVDDVYGSNSQPGRARSPTKMRDVVERDEVETDMKYSATSSPKKRSRSPMKKMFGENGWLGRSPAEGSSVRNREKENQDAVVDRKGKKTMMGKLKTKLGEFAEKADLSPVSRSRLNNDKPALISVLAVSLGPPEQARIGMEIELMLVHTANSFLMNQFSQGRMSVDSIKKTVDGWKLRGRPTVIEFMYDQITQRDLVAINQHNFRFHGERAGDGVRINSMLYTWKLVASQMAIRTFCDADTVILKLLFDIEQILEMLGAPGTFLLRIQQIRATANERMRLARQQKERAMKQSGPRDHERTWHSHSSDPIDGPTIRESLDDPYGGMRLVPDACREYN